MPSSPPTSPGRSRRSTIAFAGTAVAVFHDWRLRECDYGDWNGVPPPQMHAGGRVAHLDLPYPGGETGARQWRASGGHSPTSRRATERRVLVVGHVAYPLGHSTTRFAARRSNPSRSPTSSGRRAGSTGSARRERRNRSARSGRVRGSGDVTAPLHDQGEERVAEGGVTAKRDAVANEPPNSAPASSVAIVHSRQHGAARAAVVVRSVAAARDVQYRAPSGDGRGRPVAVRADVGPRRTVAPVATAASRCGPRRSAAGRCTHRRRSRAPTRTSTRRRHRSNPTVRCHRVRRPCSPGWAGACRTGSPHRSRRTRLGSRRRTGRRHLE